MDRRDIGSWLQGPKATLEEQGMDFGYPGERLGFPKSGPGSVATMGRRLVALLIDWAAALVITKAFAGDWNPADQSLLQLEIFVAQVLIFTSLIGASFGQKLLGMQVVSLGTPQLLLRQVFIRTILMALVIPAAIWDRDGRGYHDRIARTVVILSSRKG